MTALRQYAFGLIQRGGQVRWIKAATQAIRSVTHQPLIFSLGFVRDRVFNHGLLRFLVPRLLTCLVSSAWLILLIGLEYWEAEDRKEHRLATDLLLPVLPCRNAAANKHRPKGSMWRLVKL